MRVLIAGGGTGGHLFPGVAIAEEVLVRRPGSAVLFVGTRRGIEARVLPDLGYDHAFVDVRGLMGKSLIRSFFNAMVLPTALYDALSIVRRFRPDIAVGVGGYASGPPLLAAWLLGVPFVLLEQNSIPGATNRWLGRFAKAVFTQFEITSQYFPTGKVVALGNPIRRQLLDNFLDSKIESSGGFRLLVLGGSQGAHGINRAMISAADALAEADLGLSILHQSGPRDRDDVQQAYEKAGIEAEVREFIHDVSSAYREADLVLCRAGATTIAEVTVAKKASVLIPFPHATHNHQELNAKYLADAGAAMIVRESELSGPRLVRLVVELARDPERRQAMEQAAARIGRPEAAREIVDACESITRRSLP